MLEPSRRHVRMVAVGVLIAVVASAAWWFFFKSRNSTHPKPETHLAALPVSTSPYLNTKADAQYIGSAACIRCHLDEHKSYLRTGMSRSTAEVNLDTEPPDGAFDHPLSHRRFEVQRKD